MCSGVAAQVSSSQNQGFSHKVSSPRTPIPKAPSPSQSTKSAFLCAFNLRNPRFRAFRAQNRGFCALLGSGTPVFRLFEHKIEAFVRFCPLEPSFSGFSSTKSAFLCSGGGECGIVKRNRGDAYHFAAAPTPPHQHPHTSTSAPATAPQQWYQALSSAVLAPCSAVQAPSSAFWRRVMPSSTVLVQLLCRLVTSGAV